ESIDATIRNHRMAIAVVGLRSSIAVGSHRFDRAISIAAEALDRARRSDDVALVAEAAKRAAFAHLAVGDLAAVERAAAESIAAARAVRAPLVAARVRLMLVEALRRSGRKPGAAMLLQRITRLREATLPPILRAHGDLCRDLL